MSENRDSFPRPIDPQTREPLALVEQPGYYPGYSTLREREHWEEATRRVVLDRVDAVPPLRYFAADDAAFWSIVFEHLLPQADRTPNRRVAIINAVDDRLGSDRSPGYRFADMPPDREAYRLGREAIDEESRAVHGGAFRDLTYAQREDVLSLLHDGRPRAAAAIWQRMSIHRFWQLIVGDAIDAYYAHPWAWDEIGFGGPAYPRAYTRLERGDPEPWEVRERRYSWAPPESARSDETENVRAFHIEAEQHRSHEPKERRR